MGGTSSTDSCESFHSRIHCFSAKPEVDACDFLVGQFRHVSDTLKMSAIVSTSHEVFFFLGHCLSIDVHYCLTFL